MNKNITIVKVETDEQWKQIRPLSEELQAFEKSIRPERKPYSENNFKYIKNNVTQQSDGVAFLAINEAGEGVGYITAWLEESDGLDPGHHYVGEITDAYIKPAYRNAYTFKKMGLMVAAHFKELGLDRLSFQTLATNTRMQDLFITLGFKPHKVSFEIKLDEL